MELADIQILKYSPTDKDEIIALITKVLKDLNLVPNNVQKIEDEDLFNIPNVYKDKGRFWVAKYKNKVVGTVAIRDLGDNIAKLNRMFVLFEYHGSGIGQNLLRQAIKFAKDSGYKKIILNTNIDMKRAHKFYEKNGFSKYKTTKDEYLYEMILT